MESNLESFFRGWSVDAECGDVQGAGWYGIVRGPITGGCDGPGADDAWAELSEDDRQSLILCAGVIIGEDSQGFINVRIIDDAAELESEWARIESEVSEFEDSIEE